MVSQHSFMVSVPDSLQRETVLSLGFTSPGAGSHHITSMMDFLLFSEWGNNHSGGLGDVPLPCPTVFFCVFGGGGRGGLHTF